MRLIITIFLLLGLNKLKAQQGVTDDGKYVYSTSKDATVLQSTTGDFKLALPLANSAAFINGGKQFIYVSNDSLLVFDIKTKKPKVFKEIRSYEEINFPWMACRPKTIDTKLVLLNISNNKKIVVDNITDYKVSNSRNSLLLTQTQGDNVKLLWLSIGNDKPRQVWSGLSTQLLDVALSPDGIGVALMRTGNLPGSGAVITYWSSISNTLNNLIADGLTPGLDKELTIYKERGKKLLGFNRTGNLLLFYQQEKVAPITRIDKEETQVWSYLDAKVYPYQEHDANFKRNYASVIDVTTSGFYRLEGENELLEGYEFGLIGNAFDAFSKAANYLVVRRYNGDVLTTGGDGDPWMSSYSFNEMTWNKATGFTAFLVSLSNGKRSVLASDQLIYDREGNPCFQFSPSGKYVVFYDHNLDNYVLTELASGKKLNITSGIPTKWTTHSFGYYLGATTIGGRISNGLYLKWLPKENGMIIMDAFWDSWKIDFNNLEKAKCVTNRYGRDRDMRMMDILGGFFQESQDAYGSIEVDDFTNTGWWCKQHSNEKLEILVPPGGEYEYENVRKANHAKVFIVTRSNMKEPKEVLLTNDFKQFRLLVPKDTSLCQLAVKKEIIAWKTFKGYPARGFLYKPVGFDPSKKYPVIVYYYMAARGTRKFELLADVNTIYQQYLRDGYLVFCPEIRRTLGEIGTAGYDFVVSGAEKIMQLPYVNSKKMGLIGASFGGYQTNFLITHTNLFAAAVSETGASDLVSDFGSINEAHRLPSAANESGQFSSGATPWNRPDLYIRNSPIFYADRVTTPLLLRHSMDPNVPIEQSIEFFMALRRLGKKVWFLTDHVHAHTGPAFMKKTKVLLADQFFDHYLKDAPAPLWMLEGVPAKLRGIESRTELDSSGRTPGPGLLIENRKPFSEEHAKILENRTMVTMDGRIEDVK